MRLKVSDLQTVHLKKRTNAEDDEGNLVTGYGEPIPLKMNVQQASGTINAQLYGLKLIYMLSCKYQGDKILQGVNENDGVCVYVDEYSEPDYVIKTIENYSTHKNIMLERIDKYENNSSRKE